MDRNIRRYRESLEDSSQQEWGATGHTTERGNDPEATGSDLELTRPFGSLHQARHHARIALRNEEEENSLFNELMRSFEARAEHNLRQEEAITGSTAERRDRESNGSNPSSPDFRNGIRQEEATTRPALQDIEEEGSDISEHTRILRQTLINASNLADYLFSNDILDDEDLPLPTREAFFATGILSLNASSSRPTEACPICIEDIDVSTAEAREAAVVVVRCGHMYHRECVMRWFNELHPDAFFGTDPICRQRLFVAPGTGDGDWYNEEGEDVFTENGDEDGAGDDDDDDDDDVDGYDYGGYYTEEDIYDEYEDDDLESSHLGLMDAGPADEPSLTPAPYGTQANIRNDISRLIHRLGERSRLELRHRLLVDNERHFIERNADAIAGTETVEWDEMSGTTVRIRRTALASMQEDEDGIRQINVEIEELTDRIHAQVNELAN